MDTEEIRKSFNTARSIMWSANELATHAIGFAAGKLRALNVCPDVLRRLKRELQGFDSTTGKWKKQR